MLDQAITPDSIRMVDNLMSKTFKLLQFNTLKLVSYLTFVIYSRVYQHGNSG